MNFISVSPLRLIYLQPSVDPSPTHFFGEFPGLGLALVPDIVFPEAERMQQKYRFKFLPWSGFEPRTLQSDDRKRYHSTTAHAMAYIHDTYIVIVGLLH